MGPHMPLRPEAGLAAAGLFSGSVKLACAARAVSIAGLCTQLRRSQASGGGPSFAGHGDAQRRPCTRRGRAAHAVWPQSRGATGTVLDDYDNIKVKGCS